MVRSTRGKAGTKGSRRGDAGGSSRGVEPPSGDGRGGATASFSTYLDLRTSVSLAAAEAGLPPLEVTDHPDLAPAYIPGSAPERMALADFLRLHRMLVGTGRDAALCDLARSMGHLPEMQVEVHPYALNLIKDHLASAGADALSPDVRRFLKDAGSGKPDGDRIGDGPPPGPRPVRG